MITFVFLLFLLFFNADHPFFLDRHGYEDSLMNRAKQEKRCSIGHAMVKKPVFGEFHPLSKVRETSFNRSCYDTETRFW